MNLAADLLLIAFGVGVWMSARGKRALHFTAGLLIGNAVIGFVVSAFFPIYLGEAVNTLRNTRSAILGAASVVVFLLVIGSGAAVSRTWFRFYSIGTLLAFLGLGILGLLRPSQTPTGEYVSLVGVQERTMIYGYLLWVAVLAIHLLRRSGEQAQKPAEPPIETPRPFDSEAAA